MRYRLTRDGEPYDNETGTHDEMFAKLLRVQGQSVHYATTYDGWRIERVNEKRRLDDAVD